MRDLDLRGIGWNVVIPATEALFNRVSFLEFKDEQESNDYLTMLNTVLKSLDPAIIEITRSKDTDNAYVVQHENVGAIIAQANNGLSSIPSLSSGTKYGFNITNIFFQCQASKDWHIPNKWAILIYRLNNRKGDDCKISKHDWR